MRIYGYHLQKIYCDKATGKNFDRLEYMRLKRLVKKRYYYLYGGGSDRS